MGMAGRNKSMCYHNLLLATREQKKLFSPLCKVQAGQQHHRSRKDCPTRQTCPPKAFKAIKCIAHTSAHTKHTWSANHAAATQGAQGAAGEGQTEPARGVLGGRGQELLPAEPPAQSSLLQGHLPRAPGGNGAQRALPTAGGIPA